MPIILPNEDSFQLKFRFPRLAMVVAVISIALCSWFIKSLIDHRSEQDRRDKLITYQSAVKNLKAAIATFHTDTHKYPVTLLDLCRKSEKELVTTTAHGQYHGPYLLGIPGNPEVFWPPYKQDEVDDKKSIQLMVDQNWKYDVTTGQIKSPIARK